MLKEPPLVSDWIDGWLRERQICFSYLPQICLWHCLFYSFSFFCFLLISQVSRSFGPLHHVKGSQLSVFRLALLGACFKFSKRILEPLCFICSFFGRLENGWEGFLNLHFYQAEKVEHSWAADLTIKGQRLFVWKFQKKIQTLNMKMFS